MKGTVAAIMVMLCVFALPLVQSQAAEVQIQGQIQVPREQSPAGGIGEVLVVVGSNVLAIANAIYTTLNMIYTTLCGGFVGILMAVVNGCYTSIVATFSLCFDLLIGTVCAGIIDFVDGLCTALLTSSVDAIDAILSTCVDLIDAALTICAGGIGAAVAAIIDICGGIWTFIAGLDILNMPLLEAGANGLFLIFVVLDILSSLCTVIGLICLPCGGFCISPISFMSFVCVSIVGGTLIGCGSDIAYYLQSCCSMLPFL